MQQFIDERDFNFPVLIDEKDSVTMIYKVEKVPTRLIIAPDGNIYFKDTGFSKQTMIHDINAELELLRDKFQFMK